MLPDGMTPGTQGDQKRDAVRQRTAVCTVLSLLGSCLLGLALVSAPVTAQQAQGEGFTADERRRLMAGELVTRRQSQRRGQLHLIGGNAWQVVDQPVDVAWRALADADSYQRMLPATERATVISHNPGERVVRFRHAVGFMHASYHMRMRYDHERRDISFSLDTQRPNDLRAGWGFLGVSTFEDDPSRSLISWGVMADVGGGMIGGMLRGEVHEWLLRVPETIGTYLDDSGHRYAHAAP